MAQEEKFNAELKQEFVNALLACTSVSSADTRNTIIKELPDEIQAYSRQPNDRVDVINLVNRCLDFEEGVCKLVETVRFIEGGSEPMKRVYQLVPRFLIFQSEVISYNHFADLLGILLEIDDIDFLKKAWVKAISPGHHFGKSLKTILAMVHQLGDFDLSVSPHPLVTFADQIAENKHDLADRLQAWKTSVITKCGVAANDSTIPDSLHLLVTIRPNKIGPKREIIKNYALERFYWCKPPRWQRTVGQPTPPPCPKRSSPTQRRWRRASRRRPAVPREPGMQPFGNTPDHVPRAL